MPAISLHLEVSANGVTVARELSVLFDVPDLYAQSSFANANRGTVTAGPETGMRPLNIRREEQRPTVTAGDAAASGPVAPADEDSGSSARYQVAWRYPAPDRRAPGRRLTRPAPTRSARPSTRQIPRPSGRAIPSTRPSPASWSSRTP